MMGGNCEWNKAKDLFQKSALLIFQPSFSNLKEIKYPLSYSLIFKPIICVRTVSNSIAA